MSDSFSVRAFMFHSKVEKKKRNLKKDFVCIREIDYWTDLQKGPRTLDGK